MLTVNITPNNGRAKNSVMGLLLFIPSSILMQIFIPDKMFYIMASNILYYRMRVQKTLYYTLSKV